MPRNPSVAVRGHRWAAGPARQAKVATALRLQFTCAVLNLWVDDGTIRQTVPVIILVTDDCGGY